MHKLKNRNVIFRVTDEELARLKNASNLHGARCLSEFARTIMLGAAAGVEEKIEALDGRMATVESNLSRVVSLLSGGREENDGHR